MTPSPAQSQNRRPRRRFKSPAKSQVAHVQGLWAMELGGFEPPTSWVRSKEGGER